MLETRHGNLKLHMTIEEEIFYPAVQQLPARRPRR